MDKEFDWDDLDLLSETVEKLTEIDDPRIYFDEVYGLTKIANNVLNDKQVEDGIKRIICLINANLYINMTRILSEFFKDEEAAKSAFLHSQYMYDKAETFWRKEE